MGDGENGVKLPTHDTLCSECRFTSGLQMRNAVLQVTYKFYSFLMLSRTGKGKAANI